LKYKYFVTFLITLLSLLISLTHSLLKKSTHLFYFPQTKESHTCVKQHGGE